MNKSQKFVIIVIILLVTGYFLAARFIDLSPGKQKDDTKKADKGSYVSYTESRTDSENKDLYFYGK